MLTILQALYLRLQYLWWRNFLCNAQLRRWTIVMPLARHCELWAKRAGSNPLHLQDASYARLSFKEQSNYSSLLPLLWRGLGSGPPCTSVSSLSPWFKFFPSSAHLRVQREICDAYQTKVRSRVKPGMTAKRMTGYIRLVMGEAYSVWFFWYRSVLSMLKKACCSSWILNEI